MKKVVIVQPSLRKESYTALLCEMLAAELKKFRLVEASIIDLREREIELCDGREIQDYSEQTRADYHLIKEAELIILGFPVYHYAITGVLKNLIDVCADAFQDKTIDFMVTALFPDDQIAYEHILDSLAVKYQVKKLADTTVYALNSDFSGKLLTNAQVKKEVMLLAENISKS